MGTRIAVLDRQLTVADILATRLREQPDVEDTSAHTGVETLHRLLEREPVDVAILDWRLCGDDGRLVAELMTAAPSVLVLVIGNGASPCDVGTAVEAGAAGWLPSDVTFGELLTGLRAAQRGEFWVPGRVALWALRPPSGPSATSETLSPLTHREREVLQGMVDGLTRQQIAHRLGMSPHTVRTHIHAVLHKLGVHSSLRAVAVARQAGLVTGPANVPLQRFQEPEAYRGPGR